MRSYSSFNGGVGGAVCDGEAVGRPGRGDSGLRGGEVGADGECLLDELLPCLGDGGRYDVAGDVECRRGVGDAEEGLELVGGLLQGDLVVGDVGFEGTELEVESFEVELAEVAGFVAVVGDLDFVLEVRELRVGEFEGLLGEEHVGEGRSYLQDGLTGCVGELGGGLGGGGARVFDAVGALVAAFEEAGDLRGVGVGIVDAVGGGGDFRAGDTEVGVGAHGGLDLLSADAAQVGFGGEQGGVVRVRARSTTCWRVRAPGLAGGGLRGSMPGEAEAA